MVGNESNDETELVREGEAADAATRRIDVADPTLPAAPDAPTRRPTVASDPEAETILPEGAAQPAHPGAPTMPPPATRRLDSTRPVEPATGDRDTEGPDLSGRLLLSRYRIGDRIGAGGFGSVYRATDELKRSTGEEADLAVKIMDAAQLKGNMSVIIQEVSRSHQVSHPNIVRVHDIHVDGDIAFMTMEMLAGGAAFRAHRSSPARRADAGRADAPLRRDGRPHGAGLCRPPALSRPWARARRHQAPERLPV